MTNQLINIAEDQLTLWNPNKSTNTHLKTYWVGSFLLCSPFLPLSASSLDFFLSISFCLLGSLDSFPFLLIPPHLSSNTNLKKTWNWRWTHESYFWSSFIMLDRLLKSVWAEIFSISLRNKGLPGDSVVKNLPANAGDVRDANSLGPNNLLEKEMATDSIQYY